MRRMCQIYLMEYEVDTMYLDPDDLTVRQAVFGSFVCSCGYGFGSGPWIGPRAPEEMQVTWSELEAVVGGGWLSGPVKDGSSCTRWSDTVDTVMSCEVRGGMSHKERKGGWPLFGFRLGLA